MKNSQVSRRRFLTQSAAALSFPTIIPATAIGKGGRPAPSERITVGNIGYGTIALHWTPNFLGNTKCQVVSVADPMKEAPHYGYSGEMSGGREVGRRIIDEYYAEQTGSSGTSCSSFENFEEMLDKEDLDAVVISTPDHWHHYQSIVAARKGIHLYGQKPISLSVAGGREIVNEIEKSGITWQTGSQQRSDVYFRLACELVRNGRIGKVKRVRVGLPGGHKDFSQLAEQKETAPLPADFNFDMWLGPAPEMEYSPALLPLNWRHNFHFSGGMITDFGAHHIDIAQWAMDREGTGPVEISNVEGELPPSDALYNTAGTFSFEAVFEDGLTYHVADESKKLMPELNTEEKLAGKKKETHTGIFFEGEDGKWIYVNRGKIDANDRAILRQKPEEGEIKLYESKDHTDNFLDCVYSGQPTSAPAETAHRTISIAHLGNIALRLGRQKLAWDPVGEEVPGDADANALLSVEPRKPWAL
ncbi:MAG: Gfo/Idh/MocA family oxidoreductase [Verrucomicrobiota bacterium]